MDLLDLQDSFLVSRVAAIIAGCVTCRFHRHSGVTLEPELVRSGMISALCGQVYKSETFLSVNKKVPVSVIEAGLQLHFKTGFDKLSLTTPTIRSFR